ncbi:hypothetical protein ABEB36_001313 [Hypothenemus hampei]|uniref:Pleiotrophin/Midkine C-terminal domain-containing protein n=1 Tax=Hypothenemus hampei TaxID=57062 RepID=A0ABD1FF34_HYPHA
MKQLIFLTLAVLVAFAACEGEVWEEDDHEVLIRSERGAKNQECRYAKGGWSECDPKTNQRSRTLTLKKGNQTSCEATKTMQKKCKKACRYEKGTWAECNAQGHMTRTDKLRSGSDPSCEQKREITKKCKNKPTKGQNAKGKKAARRNNRN